MEGVTWAVTNEGRAQGPNTVQDGMEIGIFQ